MTQLRCARCWNPVGQLKDGHIDFGVRLICAKCDDKRMSDNIPAATPELIQRRPGINNYIARGGRESE